MNNLPYLIPDDDVDLNVALLLLLVEALGTSQRGKLLLNKEKLLLFMYLIKNPIMLDRLLVVLGDPGLNLSQTELYSVNSIAVNLDPLFDNRLIKPLLKICAAKKLISVSYRKDDGFMFLLTSEGHELVTKLSGDYFENIRDYLKRIKNLKSESITNLYRVLNDIFQNPNISRQYAQHFNQ